MVLARRYWVCPHRSEYSPEIATTTFKVAVWHSTIPWLEPICNDPRDLFHRRLLDSIRDHE